MTERSAAPTDARRAAATKVAIAGKGGSGKTVLAAIMTRLLGRDPHLRVLAIDADSALGLPYALGVEVERTVAEIRRELIDEPAARARIEDQNIRAVMEEALVSGPGFQLLAMGRPEGPGCYCAVNELLRYGIERVSRLFDVTVIDCEAGPEQVNRRVVQGVDILMVVTDNSVRGVRAAGSIVDVVARDDSVRPARLGIVINRSTAETNPAATHAHAWGMEILGQIPDDPAVTSYDAQGKPLSELPDSSPSVMALEALLRKLGLLD